ncbi:MAG: hypothetical protein LV480_04655 [Methylacidiphilales bacterium]|nr:hypothetical protein [Candidatus Methylacidiphilales bacterium]
MTYEHQVFSLGNQTKDDYIFKMLRDLESKGYELVTVAPGIDSTTRYFFKRQIDGVMEALAPAGRRRIVGE